jgi:hypothetical protein
MFMIYSVVIGLLLGALVGGRPGGLATLEFRWAPLIIVGLLTQVLLFSDPVAERIGDLGPAIYVGSTLLVLAAVARNARIPGLPVVVLGAASNVVAILANGGYMPASREALAALGKTGPVVYSNSSVVAQPALWPLTDIFALPTWLPGANIFSIGDVLIGIGIAAAIAVAMRRAVAADSGIGPSESHAAGASGH